MLACKTDFIYGNKYILYKMYILTFVHRAHSSGYQSMWTKGFDTIDNVSKYIQDEWYNDIFDDWNEDDMNCKQPTKDEFTAKELERKLGKRNQIELFGAYSDYCCLVPDELILSKV